MKSNLFKAILLVVMLLGSATSIFAQLPDSKGKDFWLAFPPNYSSNAKLELFISSESASNVTISSAHTGYSNTITTVPGTVSTVNMVTSFEITNYDVIQDKAIHIVSDQEVTVYGLNAITYSTDAFMGLPTDILGTEYIISSYKGLSGSYPSMATVVGAHDGTVVTITPSNNAGSRVLGVPYNVTLNQGQTYAIASTGGANDLTGTLISSDKPVGVYGSVRCTNVPSNCSACDHVVEQMAPVSSWGKSFIAAPLADRNGGDIFRFIASEDATQITLNGAVIATLNKGAFHEQLVNGNVEIIADKPIMVAQFSRGSSCDGQVADPFMMLIPPYEQYLANYTVATPASGFSKHFINLVVPTIAIGDVQLDGSVISAASFTAVGATGFHTAQLAVTAGSHSITGNYPVGVHSYGFGNYDSYGYPGGQSLSPIGFVNSISLAPVNGGTSNVGTSHCVDATVLDQFNNPVEGVRVDFAVTDANAYSGHAFTNASGVANYCYDGIATGTDKIVATTGSLTSNAANKSWTCAPVSFSFTSEVCAPELGNTIDFTSVTGGVAPYTYSVDQGTTYSASSAFSGLSYGNYTLEVKDAANCTSTLESVSLVDVTPPNAVCKNVSVQLDSNGTYTLSALDLNNGSSDACGIAGMSISPSQFTCDQAGTNNVAFTVTDVNGNTSTCTSVVTVLDDTNPCCEGPTAIAQGVTIYVDGSGNASVLASDVDNGSTADCGFASITVSQTDFSCDNLGANLVTLTVTDVNGVISTDTATVTVVDTIKPEIVVQDVTIYLDENGEAPFNVFVEGGVVSRSDNCKTKGGVGVTGPKVYGCHLLGENNVRVFQQDLSSNQSFDDLVLTVLDTIAPNAVCKNLSIDLAANGTAKITAADIDGGSTDNCSFTTSINDSVFTCANAGLNTVTLTVTDAAGNVSTCEAEVTINDVTAPALTCNNITVQLDANGQASIASSDVSSVSDNCDVTVAIDDSTFDCSDAIPAIAALDSIGATVVKGFAGRTVTFSNMSINGSGNAIATVEPGSQVTFTTNWNSQYTSTYCSGCIQQFYIGVKDLAIDCMYSGNTSSNRGGNGNISFTAPTAPGLYTVQAGSSLQYSCTKTKEGISGSKAGAIGYIIVAPQVTVTATDANGNQSSCVATVTVEDVTAPTAVCQDITVYLDATGNVSIVAADVDGGSSDACGIASLSIDNSAFTCANVGPNTVTLTVKDVNCNVSECTAVVTVLDTVAPIAIGKNYTAQLDSNGQAFVTVADVDNGSSDNCGIDTAYVSQSTFSCPKEGANVPVTLTVVDVNGNTDTAIVIVHVDDTIKPVAVCKNITVELDDLGAASIEANAVNGGSYDNCGWTRALNVTPSAFDCSNVGANTVTMKVGDGNGNQNTCEAVVTIEDNVAPNALCKDVTLQLDANGNATLTADQMDAGSTDNCSVASLAVSDSNFTCSDAIPALDKLELNDTVVRVFAGRTVTFTQMSINGSGTNVQTVAPGSNVSFSTKWKSKYTSSYCPGCIQQFYIGVRNEAIDCMYSGNTSRNRSGNGNFSFTAPTTPGVYVVQAGSSLQYSCTKTKEKISDNLAGAIGYIIVTPEVTLTVTDVNGNSSSCNANVYIEDVTAPVAVCKADTVYLAANGKGTLVAADIDGGSNDACGIRKLTASQTKFDCSHVGANTVTLTVEDNNYNTSTCSASVFVIDTINPVANAKDITVYLDAAGNTSITPNDVDNGSTDACGIASLTVAPNAFTCANVGVNTVTLTATDVNGNVSEINATVTVVDTVAPVVLTQNIEVYLDGSGNASITTGDVDGGSNDACGIASLSVTPNTFTCANVGENTVTLTATDNNGNASSTAGVVTVKDSTDPVALTQNLTVYLDANGEAVITAQDVDNGSNDVCGIASLSISQANFSCDNLGANTVVLTATDNNGNASTAPATVTVIDSTLPVVVCVPSFEVCDGEAATWSAPYTSDNCSVVSVSSDYASGTTFPVGTTTVTYTVVDQSGNQSECSFDVVVNPLPEVTISESEQADFCQGGAAVLTANSSTAVTYSWDNGDATQSTNVYASGTYSVEVTNANGCSNDATIDVDYNKTELLSAYTILVKNRMHLYQDEIECGGAGIMNSGGISQIYGSAANQFTADFTVSPRYANHLIKIQPYATQWFDIGDVIDGNSNVNLPAFEANTNLGGTNIYVYPGQTYVMTGSNYGNVNVAAGGTLVIANSNVNMTSLTTGYGGSTVEFTNCDNKVHIKNTWVSYPGLQFNPDGKSVVVYVGPDYWNSIERVTLWGGVGEVNASVYTKSLFRTYNMGATQDFTLNGTFIAHELYTMGNTNWSCALSCSANCEESASKRNEYAEGLTDDSAESPAKATQETVIVDVYPNPSQGIVNFGNVQSFKQIRIMDAKGALVKEINNLNEQQIVQADLLELPSGVYTTIFVGENSVQTEKFVITK